MNLQEAMTHGRDVLAAANIEDAEIEAEVLLREVLSLDRVQLFTGKLRELKSSEAELFQKLLQRRISGEPTAYIVGHREFFSLDFDVDKNVLIPRPETELLVEAAVEIAKDGSAKLIADIGTGSGAIAVSLARNLPDITLYAIDISPQAIDVASGNARKQGVANRIVFLQGNLLQPLPKPVDMIIANLPYVKQSELRQVNTFGYEPVLALNGGKDGLDVIQQLVRQVKSKINAGGALLLEIGAGQGAAVTDLLYDTFPEAGIKLSSDWAGIERIVSMILPSDKKLSRKPR